MTAVQAASRREESEPDVTEKIIEAVAGAEGVTPDELDACLYDVIDPDALNALFQQGDDGPATEGSVSFGFHGYTVTVSSDFAVEVE